MVEQPGYASYAPKHVVDYYVRNNSKFPNPESCLLCVWQNISFLRKSQRSAFHTSHNIEIRMLVDDFHQ